MDSAPINCAVTLKLTIFLQLLPSILTKMHTYEEKTFILLFSKTDFWCVKLRRTSVAKPTIAHVPVPDFVTQMLSFQVLCTGPRDHSGTSYHQRLCSHKVHGPV